MFRGIVECVNQPRYWGLRHQGPRGCGENVGHCLETDFEPDENKECQALLRQDRC